MGQGPEGHSDWTSLSPQPPSLVMIGQIWFLGLNVFVLSQCVCMSDSICMGQSVNMNVPLYAPVFIYICHGELVYLAVCV